MVTHTFTAEEKAAYARLTPEAAMAVEKLASTSFIGMKQDEDGMSVYSKTFRGYRLSLSLKDFKGEYPEPLHTVVCDGTLSYSEDTGMFTLLQTYFVFPSKDDEKSVAIHFSDAKAVIEPINAFGPMTYGDSVMTYLAEVADRILEKQEFGDSFLTEAEKRELPLLTELLYFSPFSFERPTPSFTELKRTAGEFGHSDIVSELCSIEKLEKVQRKRRIPILEPAASFLTEHPDVKYEDFYRSLYSRVAATQEEFPTDVKLLCNREELCELREKAASLIRSYGFEGEYPLFKRVSDNIRSYVRCIESVSGLNEPMLTVESGYLRGNGGTDLFSCRFKSSKRRFFCMKYIPKVESEDTEDDDRYALWLSTECDDSLDECIRIVCKAALREKLDKPDYDKLYDPLPFKVGFIAALILVPVVSVLMGLLFTVVMILALLAEHLFSGNMAAFSAAFAHSPWLELGLIVSAFCALFISVGLIINYIASRRRK